MNHNRCDFLGRLAAFPPETFEARFLRISTKLGLEARLSANELRRLFEAAFGACLCNIAFNGMGGCSGEIKPERERGRIALEQRFMAARDRVFESPGWKALPAAQRRKAHSIFLTVFVADHNLDR